MAGQNMEQTAAAPSRSLLAIWLAKLTLPPRIAYSYTPNSVRDQQNFILRTGFLGGGGASPPGPDANWFFKCTGPEKTMQANAQRFDRRIASVRAGQ